MWLGLSGPRGRWPRQRVSRPELASMSRQARAAEVLRGTLGYSFAVGRRRNCALSAFLLLVVSLTAPGAAVAKPGYVTFPAERQSQLTVKGARGFEITV